MLTMSFSNKEIQLLKKSINTSIKNCERSGLINESEFQTLGNIMDKLQQSTRLPGEPLLSSHEIGYQETILEH